MATNKNSRKSVRESAHPSIVEVDGVYSLPGLSTDGGNPLASRSRAVIESIRAELMYRGGLDASLFGPYSVFSTYRDLIVGTSFVTRSLVDQLVESDHVQHPGDCECIWSQLSSEIAPAYHELCDHVGIVDSRSPQSESHRGALLRHLLGLPDHEVVVFGLLNGMRGVPISVSLLYLHGALIAGNLHAFIEASNTTGRQITERGAHHLSPLEDEAVRHIDGFLRNMRAG